MAAHGAVLFWAIRGDTGRWMGIEWESIGLLGAGLAALIIAIVKGYIYLPVSVEQFKSEIAQWKHRWEAMRDDRDYWRRRAHANRDRAREAVDLQNDLEGDEDAS